LQLSLVDCGDENIRRETTDEEESQTDNKYAFEDLRAVLA
jgi:hypothetical protein